MDHEHEAPVAALGHFLSKKTARADNNRTRQRTDHTVYGICTAYDVNRPPSPHDDVPCLEGNTYQAPPENDYILSNAKKFSKKFDAGPDTSTPTRKAVGLCDTDGIGKTELAAAYFHFHSTSSNIYFVKTWFDARSKCQLQLQYRYVHFYKHCRASRKPIAISPFRRSSKK